MLACFLPIKIRELGIILILTQLQSLLEEANGSFNSVDVLETNDSGIVVAV